MYAPKIHMGGHAAAHMNKCARGQNVPVLKLNNGTLVVESNYFHDVSDAISGTQRTGGIFFNFRIQLKFVKYLG